MLDYLLLWRGSMNNPELRPSQLERFEQRQFGAWLTCRELATTLSLITPFVMPPVSIDPLVDVANLVRVVLDQNVPGDLVECGVWQGGNAFIMVALLKQAGVRKRKVGLF